MHQAALPLKGLIYILYIFFSFRVLVCLTVSLGHSTDSTDVILSCCVQVTRERMWRKVEKVRQSFVLHTSLDLVTDWQIDLMHNDVTRLDAREECWS